jgi:hypothetical protein
MNSAPRPSTDILAGETVETRRHRRVVDQAAGEGVAALKFAAPKTRATSNPAGCSPLSARLAAHNPFAPGSVSVRFPQFSGLRRACLIRARNFLASIIRTF